VGNHRRKWSPESDQILTDGLNAGSSIKDIARELGRTPQAAHQRAVFLGMRVGPGPTAHSISRWAKRARKRPLR
jgi:transposase-like protein